MTADVQREPADVLDELAYVLHGQGCGEVCVCVDDARALLPTVQALIADAEKRAAAAINDVAVEDVRAIAVALGLGGHARPYSAHEVVRREILPAIAALDPSGAAEGAGR